jgi:hydroxymethylpyrimidine/phosphomethylpyrimidine kinase
MPPTPPIVLTIAGFDPSSGAGVTADIKTLAAHDCYGVACITALTVQSTQGVRRVEPVSPELVRATLAELAADLKIAAVRIGMLGSGAVAAAVADFLEGARLPNVVLDPIIRATSGAELLDAAGVEVLRTRLLPLATVVTPNIDEAAALAGRKVAELKAMEAAAVVLHEMGARAVIVTGGHLEKSVDLLSRTRPNSPIEQTILAGETVKTAHTHGTGCAFATAVAANLALGRGLEDAAMLAKAFVNRALALAYPLGKGTSPVNHLYNFLK